MTWKWWRRLNRSEEPVDLILPYRGRVDLIPKAHQGERSLCVEEGCEGELHCITQLKIDSRGNTTWREVHLNYDETAELIELLREAMKTWAKKPA